MTRAERTFITRCTLAVKPIDIWTGITPSGSSFRMSLAETDRKPIRTSDGSYAFLDYSGKTCTLVITSPTYLEYRREIVLDNVSQPPVLTVSLLPNIVYKAPSAATGLIVKVCNESGNPLSGAQVSAYVDDEVAVRGRLAEEKTGGEGNRIRISPGNGKLLPGDAFVVREREGEATDWGKVTDLQGDPSILLLEQPFTRKWNRGTRLLPAVRTTSDKNGMVVIPLRGHLPAICPVHVEIVAGDRKFKAVWTAEGGRVVHLPSISL
ncbi:hypothetical protein [Cohnella silvisoli]|uniref:Carboxypeptidase regulatory-like domain-containing protein n=1 Tax=Cohnella silvisoli TaxID=2873699 RepID=A0ABV1L3M7_9BACL|nr:hypothetical protein [Cohnella silvisoli]MCD9025840.1 hypothetical protein [Cohnella silvisoli]